MKFRVKRGALVVIEAGGGMYSKNPGAFHFAPRAVHADAIVGLVITDTIMDPDVRHNDSYVCVFCGAFGLRYVHWKHLYVETG